MQEVDPSTVPMVVHLGDHYRDNTPARHETTVRGMLDLLLQAPAVRAVKDGPYFQTVDFDHDAATAAGEGWRKERFLVSVAGYVADLDGGDWSPERIAQAIDAAGCHALAYTTYSATPQQRKWRVFFPFAAPVAPAVGEAVARCFEQRLGAADLEPRCAVMSQLWYLPAVSATGAYFEAFQMGAGCGLLDAEAVAALDLGAGTGVGAGAGVAAGVGPAVARTVGAVLPGSTTGSASKYPHAPQDLVAQAWNSKYPLPELLPHIPPRCAADGALVQFVRADGMRQVPDANGNPYTNAQGNRFLVAYHYMSADKSDTDEPAQRWNWPGNAQNAGIPLYQSKHEHEGWYMINHDSDDLLHSPVVGGKHTPRTSFDVMRIARFGHERDSWRKAYEVVRQYLSEKHWPTPQEIGELIIAEALGTSTAVDGGAVAAAAAGGGDGDGEEAAAVDESRGDGGDTAAPAPVLGPIGPDGKPMGVQPAPIFDETRVAELMASAKALTDDEEELDKLVEDIALGWMLHAINGVTRDKFIAAIKAALPYLDKRTLRSEIFKACDARVEEASKSDSERAGGKREPPAKTHAEMALEYIEALTAANGLDAEPVGTRGRIYEGMDGVWRGTEVEDHQPAIAECSRPRS